MGRHGKKGLDTALVFWGKQCWKRLEREQDQGSKNAATRRSPCNSGKGHPAIARTAKVTARKHLGPSAPQRSLDDEMRL